MGYNIGTRLIEDFLAKSNLGRCSDFKEVGEVVAKVIPCRPFPLILQPEIGYPRLGSNRFSISVQLLHTAIHHLLHRLVGQQAAGHPYHKRQPAHISR